MTVSELKTKILDQNKEIALVSFSKSTLERSNFKIEGFYKNEEEAAEAAKTFEEDAAKGIDIYYKSDLT